MCLVSIAIFGAFGMGWLAAATRMRIPHDRAGLMIHPAFFWITTFYGFFPCAMVPGANVRDSM